MKHRRAAKLALFDGESGRTYSLKEVHTRHTAAADVPGMCSPLKYAVLQQPPIIQHHVLLYNLKSICCLGITC